MLHIITVLQQSKFAETHVIREKKRTRIVVKHTRKRKYIELSERDYDLWRSFGSERNTRKLYYSQIGKDLANKPSSRTEGFVRRMVDLGFLVSQHEADSEARTMKKVAFHCSSPLKWGVEINNVDAFFSRVYGLVGWVVFNRAFFCLAILVIVLGITAKIFSAPLLGSVRALKGFDILLLGLILTCKTIAHELAHCLTLKHFNREVNAIGLGWYMSGLCCYVDTSDAWLEPADRRAKISFAGPALDLLAGCIFCLWAYTLTDHAYFDLISTCAAVVLVSAIANLCPILEYDGYHILCDLTGRPNLRQQAADVIFGSRLHDFSSRAHRNLIITFLVVGLISLAALCGAIYSMLYALALPYTTEYFAKFAETVADGAAVLGCTLALSLIVADFYACRSKRSA